MAMLARFIYRCDGQNGGLFIGAGVKGQAFFEHNSVYEISEILGQTMLKKVGKSIIREQQEIQDDSLDLPNINWGWKVNDIISDGGREIWLTREEYEQVMKNRENN